MVDFTNELIPVDQLRLDLENPRLYAMKLAGHPPQTEEELERAITTNDSGSGTDEAFRSLHKAVKKQGVRDPIWVKDNGDGTYLVIEGNRRTTVLRALVNEGETPPPGVRYDAVRANVMPKDSNEVDVKLQKVRLQSGKRAWGPVNDSAVIYEFHNELDMAIEDIATEMQISQTKVKKSLRTYSMYVDYVRTTGDSNTKRYTFFNEAPQKVLDWATETKRNTQDYYEWISPLEGQAKIRSASTGRGSLRDFAKCIDDPEAIQLLREDPAATVEDAYEVVKENDVMKDMTFLKRILPMAKSINEMDETQLSKLASERRIVQHLKSLRTACDRTLRDIEEMNNLE